MVLKSVLMSVDLPRPDSPAGEVRAVACAVYAIPTDDHGSELESLPHALSVHLVGKICKANEAHELFADDGGTAGLIGRGRQ